jgi:hypothetical protein
MSADPTNSERQRRYRSRMTWAAILLALAATAAQAQQRTFRDAGGRTIGTAARDGQGTVTFRDARGRTTGTLSHGVLRDSRGRTVGYGSGR